MQSAESIALVVSAIKYGMATGLGLSLVLEVAGGVLRMFFDFGRVLE